MSDPNNPKQMQRPSRGSLYRLADRVNRLICRVLYQVAPLARSPVPESGPVLLVSDHSSFNDPMVLAATTGRPIIFLTAREVYQLRYLRWLCQAGHYIPVDRGNTDIGAVRAMLRALRQGEVVALFPEGGIDQHREESGHLGVGYLALKTGAPVVPASIAWDQVRSGSLVRSLVTPGRATIRYGTPITSQSVPNPDRESIQAMTAKIMGAIRNLQTVKG